MNDSFTRAHTLKVGDALIGLTSTDDETRDVITSITDDGSAILRFDIRRYWPNDDTREQGLAEHVYIGKRADIVAELRDAPTIGALVFDVETRKTRRVVECPSWLLLMPNEFPIESLPGCFTIGVLTGRTRRVWQDNCPTIERYLTSTIALDGAVYGMRGDRIPGMHATRSANV